MAIQPLALIAEYLTEMQTILDSPAGLLHSASLHTPEAAANDTGNSMRYCPGCRFIFLSDRNRDMAQSLDDTQPQRGLGNKSRRDERLDALNERRDIEAIP